MAADSTAVFLGPSLAVARAEAILPAQYHPPAKMGDVYALLGTGVRRILLIDGIFQNQPSVWQRELLAAMREGIEVFGSSSMGALRAAELSHLGMVGYGQVFAWYQAGDIDGDDEVAILHGEADTGFRVLSEPLVNIRATLGAAVQAAVVSEREGKEIVALAKTMFYPKRSFANLLEVVRRVDRVAPRHDALVAFFRDHRVDIKQRDALGLLGHVAQLGKAATLPALSRPAVPTVRTAAHARIRLTCEWDEVGFHRRIGGGRTYGAMIAEMSDLLREGSQLARLAQAVGLRWYALEFLRERGIRARDEQVAEMAAQWQAEAKVSSLPTWLTERGILESEHRGYLEAQAVLASVATQMPEQLAHDWSPTRLDAVLAISGGLAAACLEGGTYNATAAHAAAIKVAAKMASWPHSFGAMHFLASRWAQFSNIRVPLPILERELPAMLAHWDDGLGCIEGLDRSAYEAACRELILTSWMTEATPAHFGYHHSVAAEIFRELLHRGADLQRLQAEALALA